MTPIEHRNRHKKLHQALDELFADFITHNPGRQGFLNTPIHELIAWSAVHKPTEPPTTETKE